MTCANTRHGLALAAGLFAFGLGLSGEVTRASAAEAAPAALIPTLSDQPIEMQRRGGGGGFRGGGGGGFRGGGMGGGMGGGFRGGGFAGAPPAFRGGMGGGFRGGGFAGAPPAFRGGMGGGFRGGPAPGFRPGFARPGFAAPIGGGGLVAGTGFIRRGPIAPGFRPPGGWVRPGFVRAPRPGFIFYPGYGYWYPGYNFYPGYGWALIGGGAVGAAVVGSSYGDCWIERRWVDGPWGPEVRRVRVCRSD